jgi:hypothetical protein
VRRPLSLLLCLFLSAATGAATLAVAQPAGARPVSAPLRAARPAPVAPTISLVALTGRGGAPAGGVRIAATSAGRVLLTPARATARYETLGVTWDPAPARTAVAAPDVRVRTRTNGAWSAWREVHQSEEATGNPGAEGGPGVRGGTDPLWVGPSDGVQVRVTAAAGGRLPSGLRAELVDPGRSPYDALAGEAGGSFRAGAVRPAMAGRPAIATRAAWGADERRVRTAPTVLPTIVAGVVHHTAGENGYGRAQVPGIIRGDFAYHLSRGWSDIGYNFLVDRFGRVWEGRGGGVDRPILGAHTGGFNTDTFAVSVLGNLDVARPSPATVEAIARVMAWKLDLYHRDPLGSVVLTARGARGTTSRYRDGTRVRMPVILGHRNVGQSACPGRYLYPALPAIRRRAAAIMKAALLEPRATPATRVHGTGGAQVTATALTGQNWRLVVREGCTGRVVASTSGRARARSRFTVRWSGRDGAGWARPGSYLLELTSRSGSAAARPFVTSVLVVPRDPPPQPAGPMATGGGGYVPVAPFTALDTRRGVAPLGPGGRADVAVLGRGGIPASGVTSVVVETVSICATRNTALAAFPTGRRAWGTHALHLPRPLTRSAVAVVPVGANGLISVRNDLGVSDVIVDVLGYHTSDGTAGAGLVPARARLYDSRVAGAGPLRAGVARTIELPAVRGVPATSMRAVLLDVTVVGAASSGALEIRPGAASSGIAARLHHPAGGPYDGLLPVAVSGGRVTLRSSTPVQVLVDAVGYYPAAPLEPSPTASPAPSASPGTSGGGRRYTGVAPVRLADTRTSRTGDLPAGGVRAMRVTGVGGVPADASAVLVNVVGIRPAGVTRLTTWPMGRPGELATALRIAPGDVRANLVVVPVGDRGGIAVGAPDAAAGVVVDLVGWYR